MRYRQNRTYVTRPLSIVTKRVGKVEGQKIDHVTRTEPAIPPPMTQMTEVYGLAVIPVICVIGALSEFPMSIE